MKKFIKLLDNEKVGFLRPKKLNFIQNLKQKFQKWNLTNLKPTWLLTINSFSKSRLKYTNMLNHDIVQMYVL
jgi:hypothetical protein